MMYLHATKADLKNCVPCAKAFHNIYDPGVEFCESSFLDYWSSMLDSGTGFMILVEHKDGDVIGGAGGVVTNFQTSSVKNAIEMFWWVDPEFRGEVGLKLYNEFIAESKRRGAKRLLMAYMANSMPDKLEKFYASKGFTPFEHHVIKNL